ncbi:MAG: S8 family peptidase [Gammaproteobacteria bacterium]|uniref:S8 family peptidase n=1 Tax=Rhodoferax sp. TaxID=50421 RepID=UPI00184DF54B|nr:S8 family peptidase [Rhodoferax sp.]MBU3899168.1 S8 family peptidase [Gammaproteobacteria bacterium]MBA3059164.1 S8 family peptidase [Rhodoferax sp.]MBU4019404.1 S8 family peptidase [Gammaproteobacteria bacterium]MBU4081968.1 S8 family peptidase [Gammaproteobacteria bacterium]MBU4114037.1 S8 family peptidase [Gammaproteobacteria bacterium]
MSDTQRPLLLFPQPTSSEREKRAPGWPKIHLPDAQRQAERISPKFGALRSAFNARRVQLEAASPNDDPELVVVFETVGSIDKFLGAIKHTPGLEWLMESDEVGIEPDSDFFDTKEHAKPLPGRLFLLGSNQQALTEVISLWNRYQADPNVKLERGLALWKNIFKHLRDVRFWGVQDRIGQDIREFLEYRLSLGIENIRFEIEAWCYASADKNGRAAIELEKLISDQGGRVLSRAHIQDIAYHGFLVEMPADGVRRLLSNQPPEIVNSERVMFFRPRGQALSHPEDVNLRSPSVAGSARTTSGQPVIALLDGLPLQNHPLLRGRLIVDDPDGWESAYEAGDRIHGTSMASLILYGELDGSRIPLARPIYARPIMRPDLADTRTPRQESTPDDVLLIDLVHRAVKRMFDGEGGSPASAPSVKVVNLSVGDSIRPFDSELSPWARLLDWLSAKYQILFVVSAGNMSADLELNVPRYSLSAMAHPDRQSVALSAFMRDTTGRRLLTPAESLNAITVGAVHSDSASFVNASDRYDLFKDRGISPYSCIGHGFRRAVKPDIVMPGGRALHREQYTSALEVTRLQMITGSASPGHLVAAPPNASGQNTIYTRGTSNATALASRGAAQAHSVIEVLRAASPTSLPERFDAVTLKALLIHGAEWGDLENQISGARPELTGRDIQNLITRYVGYGLSDIDRAISCTEQRATLIGAGALKDGEALEFRAPLPPSLVAQKVKRRLTITLAWMTPVNARNAKYRSARLWIKPPHDSLRVSRMNADWQHVQRGTVQHEILEGNDAIVFSDGDELVFKVNCAEDGGKLLTAVPFALCVTLETGEGIDLPIYQEIQERVRPRVGITT